MTTPNPLSITLSTDKQVYSPGDTLTLTVDVADSAVTTVDLVITVNAKDDQGNTVENTITVGVGSGGATGLTVSATDSFGGTYTVTGGDGKTQFILTGTVGTPPAGA